MSKKEIQVEYKLLNTQFNNGIKDIGGKLSTLNKEFKLQQETMKLNGSETEKLEGKLGKLNKELELAKDKTKLTTDALEMAKKTTGENSKETKAWSDKLIDAQRNEEYLKNAITEATGQIDKQKSSTKELTSQEKLAIETSQKRKSNLEELEKSSEDLTDSSDKLARSYELENKQAGNLESGSKALTREKEYLKKQIDLTKESVINLERQLALAKEEYGEGSEEVKKLESALVDAKIKNQDFTNSLKDAENGLKRYGDKMQDVGNKMTDTGKKMTTGLTLPIVAGVAATVKAASDFETAFTGVKKTVDEVVDSNGVVTYSYEMLEEGIRNMAKKMPASAKDIAAVAEAAGQLGIKTPDILSFTETMVMLGDSTNLSSTDAAASLARFANITGMSADGFSRLGSTIVALGNNMATTEAEIVAMSMRLAGAGTQVGLTEAQILSLASALSSVGIEAEAGGSAFSKVLINMQLAVEKGGKPLKEFAKVAGVSANDFAKAYKEDAMGALMAFIKGLSTSEDRGISAIKVLDDMGITEVRLRDSLLRAANASGVFTDAIETGTKAWDENTALTEEARKKYETFESKLKMLKNQVIDVAIEFGGPLMDALSKTMEILKPVIEKVSELAKQFSDADSETQKTILTVIAVVAALGPLLTIAGKVVSIIGGITSAVGLATPAVAGMGAAAGTAGGAAGMGALTGGLGGVVIAAAPYIAAVAGVAAVGYGLYQVLDQDVIPAVDLFADHAQYTATEVKDAYGNVSTTVADGTIVISEETKKQVGEFMTLADEAQRVTHEMYLGVGEETQTGMTTVLTTVQTMADQIVAASETQKTETIAEYSELFNNTTVLTDREMSDILASVNKGHEDRVTKTNELKTKLTGIYDEIRRSGVDMTKKQKEDIDAILEELRVQSVVTMSKNEAEQNVILNRLATSNTRITAGMVGDTIKELNTQKNETIRLAGETRDETVRQAEELRTLEGGKYAAKADEIIAQANEQYEGVVTAAEKTKNEGINKLEGAYGDLTKSVDTNTGEILTFWGKVKNWWNSWNPAPKNTTVTTTQETVYSSRGSSNTSSAYGAARQQNYRGGIIHEPSVFGNQSFSEKGPEAIVPLTGKEMNPYADAVARRINEYSEVLARGAESVKNIINVNATLTGSADEDRLVRKIDKALKGKSDEASFAMGGV